LESVRDILDISGEGEHHDVDADCVFMLLCQPSLSFGGTMDSLHRAVVSWRILRA
jgi:hypothetical protein